MSSGPDNLVLQLLREVRGEQGDHTARMARLEARLVGMEQELREARHLFTYGLGMVSSMEAHQAAQAMGWRELATKVDSVIARLDALEHQT
jgi:hypothetical protein